MAGAFDDLVPNSGGAPVPKQGGGTFDDLVPAAPAAPTPEQQRADRLRKIARTAMDTGSGAPGASDLFGDAFTFGLQKPVAGLAESLGGKVRQLFGGEPQTFGEGYTAGTGAYQERLDEATKNAGWGGTAANVAGSVLAGGPARGAVESGLWPMVKNAAGWGAVEGAARNAEDPVSAAEGAVKGGAAGGATALALGGAGKMANEARPSVISTRRAERLANRGTDPAELRQQARSLYRQLDQGGVAYDNNQSTQMVDDLLTDLHHNGYDPQGVHSVLNGVVTRLEDLRGQPVSLETLQHIREQVGSNAGANEPQVRRIAGRILNGIDGFVTNVDPAMSSLPAGQVAPMWTEARRLWRTANTAEDIGWRLDKADSRSARTNSGTNIENPIRQNIGAVLDKATQPRRFNPYNAAELEQMRRVVEGTPTRNLLRSVGNRFGGSGPLGASSVMGGSGATMLASLAHGAEPSTAATLAGAAGLGLYGAGKAARMKADRMAQDEADALVRLISTGSLDQAPRLVQQTVPTRASLARLMAGQSLGRGAGVYAGGEATR